MRQQISDAQFNLLLVWVIMATGFLTLPAAIGEFVHSDAWLAALLFGMGAVVSAALFIGFAKVFPGQTLTMGILTAFGPLVGRVMSFWILLWYYIFLCLLVREATFFVNISVLPLTPSYIVAALLVVCVSYAAYLGIEVITRMVQVITPLVLIITLVLFLLALQHAHVTFLQPVLAEGTRPVLRASILPWTFSMEFITLLTLVPNLKPFTKLVRNFALIITALVVGGLFIELVVTVVLGPTIGYTGFPILEVVRSISYGELLERLDPFYMMSVIAVIFLKVSYILYSFGVELKETIPIQNVKPVILNEGLSVWAGSIAMFRSTAEINQFMLFTAFAYFGFTLLIIPLSAMLWQIVRGKKNHKEAPA